jgi:FkbM family methyltransferase
MQRWFNELRFKVRNRLVKKVYVHDGEHGYSFRCESPVEIKRAQTLLVKEEGTVRWIRTEVKAGQVFYDIGANIGLYTLMAARRVAPGGLVYAFEPHVANVNSLLHNISRNDLNPYVKVISAALNDSEGFFDFNYAAWVPGSSMSQLNDTRDDLQREFRPVFSEYKYATTVDRLIETGAIHPADHVKLDVDGNELLILRGMAKFLQGRKRPKTVQAEINPRHKEALYGFMEEHGYVLSERHDTMAGKQKIASGRDKESISYNCIFRPRSQ